MAALYKQRCAVMSAACLQSFVYGHSWIERHFVCIKIVQQLMHKSMLNQRSVDDKSFDLRSTR